MLLETNERLQKELEELRTVDLGYADEALSAVNNELKEQINSLEAEHKEVKQAQRVEL